MARRAASLQQPTEESEVGLRIVGAAKRATKSTAKRTSKRALAAVETLPAPERVPIEYASCRSLGHSWQHRKTPYNPQEDGGTWQGSMGAAGFVSVCDSCGTKRTKWVMRSGALGHTSYDYPDGYSTHGEDRLAPMEWRRAFVVRVFGD